MTTPADRARDNAISIEGKKDGLYQRKGADWVVRFTIQSADLCDALKDAPLGTRYAMALVEIDDNEEPKDDKAGILCDDNDLAPTRSTSRPVEQTITTPTAEAIARARKPVAPEKRLAQQAGICCADQRFWKFLGDVHNVAYANAPNKAADYVRYYCMVTTRADIIPDTIAGSRWADLYGQFIAWRDYPEIDLSPAGRERENVS